FAQWVLEDSFTAGRPPYEEAGVQVVADVEPYELMKLRLLNASHQAMCYLAYLSGYRLVHHAAQDPLFRAFLLGYMDADGVLTAWLRESDVAAVLIRPDAYVFGAAHQPAGAAGLVHALRQALRDRAADLPGELRAAAAQRQRVHPGRVVVQHRRRLQLRPDQAHIGRRSNPSAPNRHSGT